MLSIITPVYNGEKYLDSCIDSVINSGLTDYELIIVNDGSIDHTGEIIDSYAAKYNVIKVIHGENQGQGLARNSGIKISQGDYLAFLDVDDTLVKDGLSGLYEIAQEKNYDIVSGTYYRKDSEGTELIGGNFPEGVLSRTGQPSETLLYNQMKTQSIFGYIWNKIYKKEFLMSNNIWMDDIREVYMEDTVFNIRTFGKDPNYYHVNIPVYCYNIQEVSTTRKYEPEIAEKNVRMIEKLYENLVREGTVEKSMDLVVPLAIRSFSWSIVRNNAYEGNSFNKKLKTIRIFMDNQDFKNIICGKTVKKEISKLPSLMERVFYSGCIFLIKLKAKRLLALGFTIGNPFMQFYINKNLK